MNKLSFRLFSFILLSSVFLTGCQYLNNNEETKQPRNYLSEVKSVNKLLLAQMTISKMATIDDIDINKAEGMKQTVAGLMDAVKVGDRKAAYSYDTYLRAYLDLSGLTPEDIKVDDATKTITLNLPSVQTEFAGRDLEIREDHYRVSGLRAHIDPKERAEIKEKMNTVLKKEVEEKSEFRSRLEAEGRMKADTYFKALLGTDGYNVIVNFK